MFQVFVANRPKKIAVDDSKWAGGRMLDSKGHN